MERTIQILAALVAVFTAVSAANLALSVIPRSQPVSVGNWPENQNTTVVQSLG